MTIDIRPSPIAGKWYPAERDDLQAMIATFLNDAPPIDTPGQIYGLIVPHAGYIYSGPVAAHAFRSVMGMSFDRVVILSPMHHVYRDPILTSDHDAYSTPLGTIPVDHLGIEKLKTRLPLGAVRQDPEHAIEIELPFLQFCLQGDFELLPLMLRDQSWATVKELAHELAALIAEDGRSTLLVASSDLSHFYTEKQARQLDRHILDAVEAYDAETLIRLDEEGKAFACGRGAIAAVMVAAQKLGASRAQIAHYATSADATGDKGRVVGYSAAILHNP